MVEDVGRSLYGGLGGRDCYVGVRKVNSYLRCGAE